MDNTPLVQNVFNPDPANIQKVGVSSSSAQTSNAVSCEHVLLIADTDCHIVFGTNPTATTSSLLLPAKTYIAFECQPTDKVAVIEDTATGNLWVVGLN